MNNTLSPRNAKHALTIIGRVNGTPDAAYIRHFCGFLFLLCCLSSAGCGSEQQPTLRPLADDAIILAFGDSLTQGTGANPAHSYPQRLQILSGRKVINAGVAGEVSADGVTRLPEMLAKYSPQLVVLCHGGNDMLRKLDHARLRSNLEKMIALIRASGAELLFLGVPKPALLLGPAEIYQQISEKHQLLADLEIISEVLSTPSWKSDPIHPNAAGYEKIAESIHAILSNAGAL